MKKIFLLVLFAILGVLTWYFFVTRKKPKEEGLKMQPIAVSQHSDSFNTAVNKLLSSYYALTEAFVNWDTARINDDAATLKAQLGQADFYELKKDTLLYQTALSSVEASKTALDKIIKSKDITDKRRSLHTLSQNMYDLLRTIRYDQTKVYLQECPMAFNEEEPGDWLSKNEAIRNPYLGLHHPKYKSGMIECGSTKDSLNIMPTNP